MSNPKRLIHLSKHLATDRATALNVGARHDRQPVLLAVSARGAWSAGVKFHSPHPMVWLAAAVPGEFIRRAELPPR